MLLPISPCRTDVCLLYFCCDAGNTHFTTSFNRENNPSSANRNRDCSVGYCFVRVDGAQSWFTGSNGLAESLLIS